MSGEPHACDRCLARTWLLGRLAGHLDCVRARIQPLIGLPEDDLIAAVGGGDAPSVAAGLAAFDANLARRQATDAGLALVCRCDPVYPPRLRVLGSAAPAVLHVAGGMRRFLASCEGDPVAIAGARRPSSYGLEVAGALGRDLGRAGVTVLSGMAAGVDAAAHAGALNAGGPTIAVLPGSADSPYPAGKRALHSAIVAGGAVVSELGPGTSVRRWMFPARNRLIAALSAMTVVVEAGERSGSLVTAELAIELGRPVGAVPGRISSPQAAGPNALLAGGARVIRGAPDIFDALALVGLPRECVEVGEHAPGHLRARPGRLALPEDLRSLLNAIGDGCDTAAAALARAGVSPERGLAAIASLELGGYLRRVDGGRYELIL